MEMNHENTIEWLTGDKTISLSLTQRKYINKVKKLKERFPEMVEIVENKDGSIFAHLPLKALKLSIILPKESSFQSDECIDGEEDWED